MCTPLLRICSGGNFPDRKLNLFGQYNYSKKPTVCKQFVYKSLLIKLLTLGAHARGLLGLRPYSGTSRISGVQTVVSAASVQYGHEI